MGAAIDMAGVVVGRLTAIMPDTSQKLRRWVCVCECGVRVTIPTSALRSRTSQSCGCLKSDMVSARRTIDLSGQRFGRLVAVSRVSEKGNKSVKWLCRCDCGQTTQSSASNLRSGASQSRGCQRTETLTKHGGARKAGSSSEYTAWGNMKERCYNESNKEFANYGDRGVYVCDGWRNDAAAFLCDMGPKPSRDHSVDRRDNNGSYTCGKCDDCIAKGAPMNCRWATRSEQMRNTRANVMLTYGGDTMPLVAWAERLGLTHTCLVYRLNLGWSVDRALSTGPKT